MSTFSTYDSTVNSFYLAFYGRPADPAGLKFWSKALADNNGDAGAIIQAFATSEEALTRFGSDTISARITDIYEQLFNRAPDAAGLDFWTKAVEQGNATLAEVSLAILKGAQSSDLDLSTLRQKAADAFTAAVEDGSTEYSGYASIEAARVLVRAVTTDATDADLATLVKAAVSFADTATKTPKVVEAIATGSTLLNLYDSARGLKDPIALTQALADTAKAAAGDPVTLESLLRGGGMDKVLKVMPTKATLTDVVEALAKGGLPAAVEVVYPTAPTAPVVTPKPTPEKSMDLKFDSVSQGEFDTNKNDNVTNVKEATVKFSYTGSDLQSGQTFQYSTDGVHWTSLGLSADAATNTVTIEGVNLTGKQQLSQESVRLAIEGKVSPVANVMTTVYLQAVDANNKAFAKAEAKIEYDGTAPTKSLYYIGLSSDAQPALTFGQYGGDEGLVQWRLDTPDSKWTNVTSFNEDRGFTLTGIDLSKTGQRLEMRVIDAAGNVGYTSSQEVKGPEQPLQFKLTPTANGLQIESSEAVDVRLYKGADIYSPLGQVSGNVTNGESTIGAQFMVRSGDLKIARVGESDAMDVDGDRIYVFGTGGDDRDALSGQYVWGFGGNDVIYGTLGNDYLVGGAGADQIYLPSNGQADVDTLVFAKGDTATGVYAGGEILLDEINGASIGDVFQLDKVFTDSPRIVSTLLTSFELNQVAIVRGVAGLNVFQPGSDSESRDYLIQWSDGETVNSVLLRNYGAVAPALTVDVQKGTMTLVEPTEQTETVPPLQQDPQPETGTPEQPPQNPEQDSGQSSQPPSTPQPVFAELVSSEFYLNSSRSEIVLSTNAGPITGMTSSEGLVLNMYGNGTSVPAPAIYSDLAQVVNDTLELGSSIMANVYSMDWDSNTFTTGSDAEMRPVDAGHLLFAGGKAGTFKHTGFEVKSLLNMEMDTVRDSTDTTSEAYVAGSGYNYLVTGGGHDAIINPVGKGEDGVLDIGYRSFDTKASDLVFGFRPTIDGVIFTEAAAFAIDKNHDGKIQWNTVTSGKAIVASGDEAVSIGVNGQITIGDTAYIETAAAVLRTFVDASAVAKGDDLLILAVGASNASILFHYTAQDDNGQIDSNELSTVAMFVGGTLVTADIEVIGSAYSEA